MSAADEAALDDKQREMLRASDSRMGAYYYWFDRTGEPAIDAILSAVAYAGKAFHSTEYWDLTDVNYGPIRGDMSAVDVIQAAANEAAHERSQPIEVTDATDAVAVHWYDCDCEYLTKFCDENHSRSALVPRSVLRATKEPNS